MFYLIMYIEIRRWAICLSCGLTHKIRYSFRTSDAGQLTGNGKTRFSYRTSGTDQLADNRKISHKRKVSSATAEEPFLFIFHNQFSVTHKVS